MRSTSIIATAIIMSIVVVLVAFIAAESAQYSNPVTVQSNGIATVETSNGTQVYNDVEYVTGTFHSFKAEAIMPIDNNPITLPNTSAPHGTHTCNMGTFTVTTDQDCSELN